MGFIERYSFFKKSQKSTDGFSETRYEDRTWENGYRNRFAYDKVVRSTHGVNCTGSCSWQIYVKNGIITYEIQQNDYPQTQEGLPEYEPRGCPSGASYSSYLYSPHRIKHPMIRGDLLRLYREKRKTLNPIDSWKAIVESSDSKLYKQKRGAGGFVRVSFDEALEIIAAANIYTIKKYGPDRIFGFSPIPAMSMVSYASGARYLSLIGGAVGSFYDWYCDLPPSSPQVFGEQTDVPESADWYNSTYLVLWGSNVPQTRRPDAHFYTEVRYKGTKTVVISPDFSEASKFADVWVAPRPGTDASLALAMGHVIFKEFHIDKTNEYFNSYVKRYSDMPHLVILRNRGDYFIADRFLRASDILANPLESDDWKTVVIDANTKQPTVINGSIGFRYEDNGKWNLHTKDSLTDTDIDPKLSLIDLASDVVEVGFADFTNNSIIKRKVPALKINNNNNEYLVASVFDLLAAHYGIDRNLNDPNTAKSYDDECAYTPAWQEKITGVKREVVIKIAREFAKNALQTKGKSMVIIGAGVNHYYYTDTIYRSVINMLTMCGCIGQSGGGWAHYVGQEKVRPLAGWSAVAFALDWYRPPKQMNSTSFYYFHTDQFRYEDVKIGDLLSPLAESTYKDYTPADFNVKAIRMGWLPAAPYLDKNSIEIVKEAQTQNIDPKEYLINNLKESKIRFAFEDPDNPVNFVRNMFVWRSNLLGASSKGHEYFLKHLLGAKSGVLAKEIDESKRPKEIVWREPVDGKLDLLVTLDFRMSTTCIYSDIVLPAASWYEKEDLSTTDMHPFIHPFSKALDPLWESKDDWDIFKELSKKFSELAKDYLGVQKELVLSPQMHDTKTELAQAFEPKDWKVDNVEIVPGKNFPSISVIERDYPNVYKQYITLGPLLEKAGNGAKGVSWDTKDEVEFLKRLNGEIDNRPKIEDARQVCEAILELAPETNAKVSHKAFDNLSKKTGSLHNSVRPPVDYSLRFQDLQVQPRRTVTSPIWSGIESKDIPYSANYQNVHEFIPWRTLTGRIQFYQDHKWMRLFGENFAVYKPPVNAQSLTNIESGENTLTLKWSTAHQKFGIHSTYVDLLILQTLSRGGPHIWISETDAKALGVKDNDWIEAFNKNGVVVARAVVSQRIPKGSAFMYHAQDKVINTPISNRTNNRGGVHNSVIKILLNPLHMIGGYAQLSYSFNYYGTIGSNRDDFVIVRKLEKPTWSAMTKTKEAL